MRTGLLGDSGCDATRCQGALLFQSCVMALVPSNSCVPVWDCVANRFGNVTDRPEMVRWYPSDMTDRGRPAARECGAKAGRPRTSNCQYLWTDSVIDRRAGRGDPRGRTALDRRVRRGPVDSADRRGRRAEEHFVGRVPPGEPRRGARHPGARRARLPDLPPGAPTWTRRRCAGFRSDVPQPPALARRVLGLWRRAGAGGCEAALRTLAAQGEAQAC